VITHRISRQVTPVNHVHLSIFPFIAALAVESTGEIYCKLLGALITSADVDIVLYYLLQLFTLVTEGFSKHARSVKELTRWAHEIFLTFLTKHAVIAVTAVLCF